VGNSGAIDVFIVHGHDLEARVEVARFVERVGLNPIILEEQPDVGLTVIEKFERDAARAAAAIVLLTPDDVGSAKSAGTLNPRARQNVVFELGYFAARVGRGRVFALMRADVEIPSDYRGVIYTVLDDHGGWKLKVAQNLKSAELPVDLEKLLQ
jgi:predicted nucleotide-binding protein